jgi:hypothetical protein
MSKQVYENLTLLLIRKVQIYTILEYHNSPVSMIIIKRKALVRIWRKENPCPHWGECKSIMKKQHGNSLNIKIGTATWSRNPITKNLSKGTRISISKRYVHSHAHCSFNSQKPTYAINMSILQWTNEENVVYLHSWLLFSYIIEKIPVICDNMDKSAGYYIRWKKGRQKTNALISLICRSWKCGNHRNR